MGNSEKPQSTEDPLQNLLRNYTCVQEVPSFNLIYLVHNETNSQHLLKSFSSTNRSAFNRQKTKLLQKKIIFQGTQHLTQLIEYFTKQQQSIFAQTFNLFALFQFPHRTLDDELNQRYINKTYFEEKQLWSILSSCIVGLSHLQQNQIEHGCLRSSTILISKDKIVKIVDPFITNYKKNSDLLLNDCLDCHAYASPQIMDNFKQQKYYCGDIDCYKSDVWILAVIIIELALLQYQDICFNMKKGIINWEKLDQNLIRLEKMYSIELSNVLKIMLEKNQEIRPNWLQLAQHIVTVNQYGVEHQIAPSKSSKGRRLRQIFEKKKQKNNENLYYKSSFANPNFPKLISINPTISQVQHPKFNDVNIKPNIAKNMYSMVKNQSKALNNKNSVTFSYIQPQQLQFQPIQLSNIETFRPILSNSPVNIYQEKTKIDFNTIVQSEIKQEQKNKRGYFQSYTKSDEKLENEMYANQAIPFNFQKDKQVRKIQDQKRIYLGNINLNYQNNENIHTQGMTLNPFINPFNTGDDRTFVTNSISTNRTYYDGSTTNGLRDGYGKLFFEDGGFYEGQWKKNNMHGYGKLFYSSGKIAFSGKFFNNKFEGYGVLYNENVEFYSKQLNFRNFDQIGKRWVRYQGNFIGDEKSGQGRLLLSNGQVYQGQFSHDLIDGKGIYQTLRGIRIQGKWINNKLSN